MRGKIRIRNADGPYSYMWVGDLQTCLLTPTADGSWESEEVAPPVKLMATVDANGKVRSLIPPPPEPVPDLDELAERIAKLEQRFDDRRTKR